ncbi:MAG: PLP-dependent aminotransferase family protein [Myxococcota bacterium]
MSVTLEIDIAVPKKGSRARLRELHRQLRDAIVSGRLKAGAQLPPSRQLAKSLGISRNTAMAVYELLLREGYVRTTAGSGTFVADAFPRPDSRSSSQGTKVAPELARRANRIAKTLLPLESRPAEFDFRLGVPDTTDFPFVDWRRLSNRSIRSLATKPDLYANADGALPLRSAIADHVAFSRAVACDADDIVVTNGAQQAFDLIARVLVQPENTTVAVEDPGYPAIRGSFASAGAKIRPVPVDQEGICVDEIPEEAQIICVTPSHQFPTGVCMSYGRRQELLDFARQYGAVIIEDDYDSEFRDGGRPLDALQTLDSDGLVVYVGTFSKTLFPSLRMGFAVAPSWLRTSLVAKRQLSDWHGSAIIERTLAAFISGGNLERHIRRMRKVYAERRLRLLAALERDCQGWLTPVPHEGGLHLAAKLESRRSARGVVADARDHGMIVDRLSRYRIAKRGVDGLVFGLGCCPSSRIDQAIERLASLKP